ncbi:MAG: histidine kinase [Pyrinomonadaceae bacterium]
MLEWTAITVARRIDVLRVTHERCEQVLREQEIAKLATEAQLRALRAQINPHFLFNALTTIGYLIQTSPPRALETLLRLTDLLRRVLRAGEEWTTLGEELKLVESYLDIERARFEERLRVRIDVPRELQELLVPSLIVQPLVENAIKHGITPLKAGGEIHIAARLAERRAGDQRA